jgi:putative acetyltransferase
MVEAEAKAAKPAAAITIRRRRDADIPALTAIRNMPQVRWGTLAVPYTSVHQMQQRLKASQDDVTALVACAGETVLGEAVILRRTMPRVGHGAGVGIMVHDAWRHCGVGSALFAAVLDLADNWLGLRRLELAVYTDNAPAIALYRKFGFEIEGVEVADAFRDGVFVDSYAMARLRGELPADDSPYPASPPAAPAAPFHLRASEPADLPGIAALMAQPIVRHGTLRLPYAPEAQSRILAEPEGAARAIVAEAASGIVGIAVLKPALNRRAHCGSIELVAVHEAWQRQGVGSALMAALLDIADNWLNLKRLHLAVLADNAAAVALYRRFGFVEEVTRRAEIFRAGGFADAKGMARLR